MGREICTHHAVACMADFFTGDQDHGGGEVRLMEDMWDTIRVSTPAWKVEVRS